MTLDNILSPINLYAGGTVYEDCHITHEMYEDQFEKVKSMLKDKIISKFNKRPESEYLKISEVSYSIQPVIADGFNYKVTASSQLIFK